MSQSMEETKPPPPPPPVAPPSATPNAVAAPTGVEVPESKSKKRKLDADAFRNSDYYKLRLLVKDLRPLFVEVLQSPDFRKCIVVHDIKAQMRKMLELTKKLRGDVAPTEKCKNPCQEEASLKVNDEKPPEKYLKNDKLKTVPEACQPSTASQSETAGISEISENIAHPERAAAGKEKAKRLDEAFRGSYVIGGSKLGWNFLVYPGSEPVYYGVTRENALAKRAARTAK